MLPDFESLSLFVTENLRNQKVLTRNPRMIHAHRGINSNHAQAARFNIPTFLSSCNNHEFVHTHTYIYLCIHFLGGPDPGEPAKLSFLVVLASRIKDQDRPVSRLLREATVAADVPGTEGAVCVVPQNALGTQCAAPGSQALNRILFFGCITCLWQPRNHVHM